MVSVILCLRLGPGEIIAFPLVVVDIVPVLIIQLFLVETIVQQTFSYSCSCNLSALLILPFSPLSHRYRSYDVHVSIGDRLTMTFDLCIVSSCVCVFLLWFPFARKKGFID